MSNNWLSSLYNGSKLGAKYSFSDKDTSEEGLINSLLGFTNSYTLNPQVSEIVTETPTVNILYNRVVISESASYSLQVYNTNTSQSISSPTQIPKGLEGWYDASNAASLIVSGSNLTGWNDLSTTSSHLDTVQGNAPQLTSRTINGKTAIEFNNDGAIYRNINVAGTTIPTLTIGVVFSIDSAQGTIVSSRTTLDSRVSVNSSLNFVMQAGSANSQTSTRTLSTSTVYRAIAVYDGVSSKLWIDGISEPMSSIVEDRLLLAMIGANGSGGTDYFDGLVGEVVVYESALTDSEAISLDKYFTNKWTTPTVVAETASYLLAYSELNLNVARKLTSESLVCLTQTFETGVVLSRKLSINQTQITITPQEVSITKVSSQSLEATSQSYSIVPREAGLFRGLAISVTAQAFTLTGPPTATLARRNINVDSFILTRTFNDNVIVKSSVLFADTKNFEIASFPITTPRVYGLLCSHLSLSVGTTPTSIVKQSKISVQTKNFDLVEQANQTKVTRTLFANTTNFDLVEQANQIIVTGLFSLETANFDLVEQANQIKVSRVLASNSTNFDLVEQTNQIKVTRTLFANTTNFDLVEQTNQIKVSRIISVQVNLISLLEQQFLVKRNIILPALSSSYELQEQLAGVLSKRKLVLDSNGLVLVGYSISSAQPSGYMSIWTGTAWESKPIKVWVGSSWVQKPVKIWTGTSWQML